MRSKGRIENIFNRKKPLFWIITVALVACAAGAVWLLASPGSKPYGQQIAVVRKHLEAERDDAIDAWKSTVIADMRQQPTFNDSGSFWVNSMTITSIEYSDEKTKMIREQYAGNELQEKRGWTDDYVSSIVIIKAVYDVDYDNTKVPYPEGTVTTYFFLGRENEQADWLIFDFGSGA